jgi:hypothetical protein
VIDWVERHTTTLLWACAVACLVVFWIGFFTGGGAEVWAFGAASFLFAVFAWRPDGDEES